jgi:hypothetical protein
VLEQRDLKQSAQARVLAIEGVPFKRGGLGQARGAEWSILALAGVEHSVLENTFNKDGYKTSLLRPSIKIWHII